MVSQLAELDDKDIAIIRTSLKYHREALLKFIDAEGLPDADTKRDDVLSLYDYLLQIKDLDMNSDYLRTYPSEKCIIQSAVIPYHRDLQKHKQAINGKYGETSPNLKMTISVTDQAGETLQKLKSDTKRLSMTLSSRMVL